MDKCLILINALQKKLDGLLIEKDKIEEEIKKLEIESSKLKSKIYVDEEYKKCNKTNLESVDILEKKYPKYIKISLFIIFILSFIINFFLNNFLALPFFNLIINSFVSSTLLTLVVGVAENIVIKMKKDSINKYNRLNYNQNIKNLSLNIVENREKLKELNIKLCQLRTKLQQINNIIKDLESSLNKYRNIRNEIVKEILENMIDKKIEQNPSLDIPSFQLVMKKIYSDNKRLEDKMGLK